MMCLAAVASLGVRPLCNSEVFNRMFVSAVEFSSVLRSGGKVEPVLCRSGACFLEAGPGN